MKLHLVIFVLLLSVAAHHVESRRRQSTSDDDEEEQQYKLFVFGDSFADVGNNPRAEKSCGTRSWYPPYGMSDKEHGRKPTGRYSNGLIQPDLIAKLLGRDECPPAERLRRQNIVDPSGMNFAVGGAGAYRESEEAPTLGEQIDSFKRLVNKGIIDPNLNSSVALVAFSGSHDYSLSVDYDEHYDVAVAMTKNVTQKITEGVYRLLGLGVEKVIVNNLPPLGCRPWFSSINNYTACYGPMNMVSFTHNKHLGEKLNSADNILLLDMEAAFNEIITTTIAYTNFEDKYAPCCDSVDPDGWCGQEDEDGKLQYTLCSVPNQSFFWDYYHPTQAGWEAVMDLHEDAIKEFLDI